MTASDVMDHGLPTHTRSTARTGHDDAEQIVPANSPTPLERSKQETASRGAARTPAGEPAHHLGEQQPRTL